MRHFRPFSALFVSFLPNHLVHDLLSRSFSTYFIVLIMVPTRELCQQVRAVTRDLTRDMETFIGVRAAFGGAPRYNQIEKIDQGCDILVGTPGRILDFVNSDVVSLSKVKYFVLDESDRMLDQGFGKDIEEIVSNMPRKRQTTMFSATMKGEKIQELAFGILNKNNCKMVSVGSDGMNLQANADVEQNIIITKKQTKMATFVNLLNEIGHDQKTIIFMGTKKSCDYYRLVLLKCRIFGPKKTQRSAQKVQSSKKSQPWHERLSKMQAFDAYIEVCNPRVPASQPSTRVKNCHYLPFLMIFLISA